MKMFYKIDNNFLSAILQYVVIVFCFLFGLLGLGLVSGAGDGTWFLYSNQIFSGSAPYSELHLKQQPFFFLITALVSLASGGHYLYQKIFYFPLILLFLFTIYKVSTLCTNNCILRSILILFIFFSGTLFEAYRFDDYHVVAHSFVLLSLYFSSLYLNDEISFNRFLLNQSFLFSFTFLTRVNEGLCILFSVFFILTYMQTSWRLLLRVISTFFLVFVIVLMSILLIMQDSPMSWLSNSVLGAASSKGGNSLLLESPTKLFLNAFNFILGANYFYLSKFLFFTNLFLLIWIGYVGRNGKLIIKILFWIGLSLLIIHYIKRIYGIDINLVLTPLSILLTGVLFLLACFDLLKHLILKERKVLAIPTHLALIAYPFSLFLFSSLSSGGRFDSLFFPSSVGILVLIIIISKVRIAKSKLLPCLLILYILCGYSAVKAFTLRYHNPYSWHDYYAPRFFSGFKGYSVMRDKDNFVYFMPTELKQLIEPVCKEVGEKYSLLSLPFSFANYYCGVRPWHGYVQTFFDTTSAATIEKLMQDLMATPPDYIFYQRQLKNMAAHENIFFGDKALPHRGLDKLIMSKTESGDWSVVYRSIQYPPSDWILIKTNQSKK